MSKIIVTLLIIALAYNAGSAQGQGRCGPTEIFQSCGSACPPTCQNPNNAGRACIALCVRGCFCRVGYLRDERTGRCVRMSECPQ